MDRFLAASMSKTAGVGSPNSKALMITAGAALVGASSLIILKKTRRQMRTDTEEYSISSEDSASTDEDRLFGEPIIGEKVDL